jgi:aryl-alcohol dehydrogenase-like predicted oxidoreductase
VPFSPLGRGFLTGTARRAEEYPSGDFRRGDPRFQGENFDADAVREVAARAGAKPGQIALAWLLQKGDDVVPIPGTKRRTYLEENVAAAGILLTAEDMRRLDEALSPGTISGSRYSERLMAMINR